VIDTKHQHGEKTSAQKGRYFTGIGPHNATPGLVIELAATKWLY
jgi:hypothetical protein